MKLAISADGPQLEAQLDARYGRCAYFIFVDTETHAWEASPNPAIDARGGAGTQAAQFIANQGAQAVISGHFGPNAFEALDAAGIKMYAAAAGRIESVVEEFSSGQLKKVTVPGASGHQGGRGRY
jgi:predicted Fe-Mo cluster-binding NifX family protein